MVMATMQNETWQCGQGLTDIRVDDAGCPVDDKYCKTQAGGEDLAVAAGAAWSITIELPNFYEARVRGLVLQAFDVAAGNADLLHTQTVTSIDIMGNENLGNDLVGAERYRADATGAANGTSQYFRGRLGTNGGVMTIEGVNNSLVVVDVIATIDVNAIRG